MLKNEGESSKDTWTTEAEGALSAELIVENGDKIDRIVQFLNDWENLDERLYDSKGGRFKLISEMTARAKDAMEVYYWYHRMGAAG